MTISIIEKLNNSQHQLTTQGAPFELVSIEIKGHKYLSYKNSPDTVRELIDKGREFSEQPFLTYMGATTSYCEFFKRVDSLAWQLQKEYQLKSGDRIAIAMRNRPEWVESYAAIMQIGAVVVPLNSWGSRDELAHGLLDSQAKVLICDVERQEKISKLDALGDLYQIVVDPQKYQQKKDGSSIYEKLIRTSIGKKPELVEDLNGDSPAQIMYTSGTTGKAKGAFSSQRSICQAIVNMEFHAMCSAMAEPDAFAPLIDSGLTPSSLLSVPLFHVSGCYAAFLLNVRAGRRLVMTYKWDPEEALKLIESEKITSFSAAPAMVIELLRHPKLTDYDISSLFALGGGGGACPPAFKAAIEEAMGGAYVGTGYGMTESNATGSSCVGSAYSKKPQSAGKLSPIVEFKTVNENGDPLKRGEAGEIWLKSITNIKEYWNRPDETANCFRDGWMATGDIGYIDEDDFVFIVGRKKDVIIRAGENIYPAEIEALVSKLPGIMESAVIGVPDQVLGEVAVLVARVSGPSEEIASDINSCIKGKLAGFKVPEKIIFRSKAFPKNATGKILKDALREELTKFI